jgi:hypothetical protein
LPKNKKPARHAGTTKHSIRAHIAEFALPPVHDGLVLGRHAPIGCKAFRRALDLLIATPFEHIEIEDERISDVLVRAAILQRVPRDRLVQFVIKEIKPHMTAEEVLHLDLEVRLTIEG